MLAHRTVSLICAVTTLAASLLASPAANAAPNPKPTPSNSDESEAKILYDKALIFHKAGQLKEALALAEEAKRKKNNESIQKLIGVCHKDLNDPASAVTAFSDLLNIFGSSMLDKNKEDAKRLLIEAQEKTGLIRVTLSEPDAQVTVDGRYYGKTPLPTPIRVNPGSYPVLITKPGFNDFTQTVEVKATAEVTVAGPLEKQKTTGKLSLRPSKVGITATVFIDGKEAGTLPYEGELPEGEHSLEFKSKNASADPRKVYVQKGKRTDVVIDIESTVCRLQVVVEEGGGDILLDEQFVGKDKWDGEIKPGKHTITVQRAGYVSYTTEISVKKGEERSLTVKDLKKQITHGEGEGERPTTRGIYLILDLIGAFSPSDYKSDFTDPCPSQGFGPCSNSKPIGFGGKMNIGYKFGIFGLEGWGTGTYDSSAATAQYDQDVPTTNRFFGAARKEEYTFQRYSLRGGIGGRVTTDPNTVRFTTGLGVGASVRGVNFTRELIPTATGVKTHEDEFKVAFAPSMIFDIGALIGSKYGTKFHIGFNLIVDFSPPLAAKSKESVVSLQSSSGANVDTARPKGVLFSGTEVFLGPILGVQIGR